MFGFYKRVRPSLDSVRFEWNGYVFQGEPEPGRLRVWSTPEGDGVGLYFFGKPPDLPSGARKVDDLRDFYRKILTASRCNRLE